MHRLPVLVLLLIGAGCKQRTTPPPATPPATPARVADPAAPSPPDLAAAPGAQDLPTEPGEPTTAAPTFQASPQGHSSRENKQLSWLAQCNYGVGVFRNRVTTEDPDKIKVLDQLLSEYGTVARDCAGQGPRSQQCNNARLDWMESVRAASPGLGPIPGEKSALAAYCGGPPD